jgi:alpha-glucosidase (family GH31 glycosyl hydrolase)
MSYTRDKYGLKTDMTELDLSNIEIFYDGEKDVEFKNYMNHIYMRMLHTGLLYLTGETVEK